MPQSNNWLTNEEKTLNQEKKVDVWEVLKERKKKGLWDGEITTHQMVEHQIIGGPHFYVVSNPGKREVTCTSCAIKHGGILEAHLLSRYKVENGIIYLDGKAQNVTPQKGT